MAISDLEEAWSNGIRHMDRGHAKYYGAPLGAWLERIEQL